jgi:hypothetical protein
MIKTAWVKALRNPEHQQSKRCDLIKEVNLFGEKP